MACDSNGNYESNGSMLNDGAKSHVKILSFNLGNSTSWKACLEATDTTVLFVFNTVYPFWTNNISLERTRHQEPGIIVLSADISSYMTWCKIESLKADFVDWGAMTEERRANCEASCILVWSLCLVIIGCMLSVVGVVSVRGKVAELSIGDDGLAFGSMGINK